VLAHLLRIDADPAADWQAGRSLSANLSRFVEGQILARSARPVLLLFDSADMTFPHRETYNHLSTTLSYWHKKVTDDPDDPGWTRLGLVVAHATDPDSWKSGVNLSPFDFGPRVILGDFDATQVAELNDGYRRPLHTPEETHRLWELVGGEPYLVRVALFNMATRPCNLAELETSAAREDGPFGSRLKKLLNLTFADAALRLALRSVLKGDGCEDEFVFQRLRSIGVIRGESRDRAVFRCRLYEDYFRKKRP
jgi:hypothetical protein